MADEDRPPTTDLLVGDDTHRDTSYDIKSKGLFVIATVSNVNYKYDTEHGEYTSANRARRYEGIKGLCEACVSELKKALKWQEEDKNWLEPTLRREEGFQHLKEEILKRWRALESENGCRPSFLMFFLVAPSKENGQFLLERGGQNADDDCWGGEHELKGERCYGRRISDLVRAIQESGDKGKEFAGIPKIFVIHTVSPGADEEAETKGPDKKKPLKVEDYTPRGSDTFVFYAHSYEAVKWLDERKKSFFLITELCNEMAKLEASAKACDDWWKYFKKVWPDMAVSEEAMKEVQPIQKSPQPPGSPRKPTMAVVNEKRLECVNSHLTKLKIKLELNANSLTGSWFDNLCTTTAANITQFLEKEGESEGNINKYNHMRAQISSTLRYRLSMADILQQQVK